MIVVEVTVVVIVVVIPAGTTLIVWWLYKHKTVTHWGKIPRWKKCRKCKGWGALDKDGEPFAQDPRTLSHVMWAHGNSRTCRPCNGHGFKPDRTPVHPRPVTVLTKSDDPPPTLFTDETEEGGNDDGERDE
jgi:hypothetical protein